MRHAFFRCLFLGVLTFFIPAQGNAASLYIDPPRTELNRGDAVELSVRLNVNEEVGECVNAIDAVLTYSENIVPVDVSIGDSIFSMWVERPTIDQQNRTISFAGGMPNGYCGRVVGDPRLTNNIVKLIVRSPGFSIGSNSDSPEAFVNFTEQTNVYLNDGFGTKVTPRTFGASMLLSKTAGSGVVDPWRESVGNDTVPPEEFSIFLRKGDLEFNGKYFISFNTTDKQTGIDTYQVMEESAEQLGSFNWGRADAPWITARSPYILNDQSLNSVIRVRAIDKAGNEYIATLLPEESMRTISKNKITSIAVTGLIVLILLGCVGVIVMFFRQRRKKRWVAVTDDEDFVSLDESGDEIDSSEYEK